MGAPPLHLVRRRGSVSVSRIATHLVLLTAALTILLPLLWVLRTSLVPRRVAYQDPPDWTAGFTLQSYEEIALYQPFVQYFLNSTFIAVMATFIALLIGVPAAYTISRWRTGGRPTKTMVLATQMLPAVAIVIPVFMMIRVVGIYDNQMLLAGVYLSFSLPFVIWILAGFFAGLPVDTEDLALVDGATRLQALRYVVVPMAAPGIIAAAIFSFVLCWNEFLFALVLTGQQARTLPVAVVGLMTQAGTQLGPMAAATVVMSLPVVVLTFAAKRYLVTGLTFGSVK